MRAIAEHLETALTRPASVDTAPGAAFELEPVVLSAWDGVAAEFRGLCQEQLMAFAGVRWPSTTPEAWVFRRHGTIVGGTMVVIQRLPLGLGSIAVAKWGPMLADAGSAQTEVYAGMVEALIEEYSRKRSMMLSIVCRAAVEDHNPHLAYLTDRGFRPGVLLNYPLRYIVKVRLSDEALRESLEQKWRYQLNKSLRQDLSFEHGGRDRLPEFTALYDSMLQRKRFADYSAYETIPHLIALEHEKARPELFFVRKDGRVIAGAIIFKGGDRAVYLYGATLEEALPLRAGYFLHWHITRWLRDNTAAEWYDLGGTDGFLGLHQFKKGLVGSSGVITPVPRVMNYADSPIAYAVGSGALWAREGFQEVLRRLNRLRRDRAQPTMPRYIENVTDARL
jgi:hypothetical protein